MNAKQLAELLADEMPSRKVIMDLGGLKVEVLEAELTTHEGDPAIELTSGPRDPDEDRAIIEDESTAPQSIHPVFDGILKAITLPND